MTPDEKRKRRQRLFRKSKPTIRALEIYDGDKYHKDVGLMWAAHSKKRFPAVGNVSQAEFAKFFEEREGIHFLIVDDGNKVYKQGRGPIAVISCATDGWTVEPHVQFFPWTTKRNILRCCVSFFQFIRNQRYVGCCKVYALRESVSLFRKVCSYGVLMFIGKIANGTPHGDEYLFSVAGMKRSK